MRSQGSQLAFGFSVCDLPFAPAVLASAAARAFAFPTAAAICVSNGLHTGDGGHGLWTQTGLAGTNNAPGGLDGGDGGDGGTDFGDGRSSSLSQMSAHRSDTSPATEQSELAMELPVTVLAGLSKSVEVKLEVNEQSKSVDVKLELYEQHMSVYAR